MLIPKEAEASLLIFKRPERASNWSSSLPWEFPFPNPYSICTLSLVSKHLRSLVLLFSQAWVGAWAKGLKRV